MNTAPVMSPDHILAPPFRFCLLLLGRLLYKAPIQNIPQLLYTAPASWSSPSSCIQLLFSAPVPTPVYSSVPVPGCISVYTIQCIHATPVLSSRPGSCMQLLYLAHVSCSCIQLLSPALVYIIYILYPPPVPWSCPCSCIQLLSPAPIPVPVYTIQNTAHVSRSCPGSCIHYRTPELLSHASVMGPCSNCPSSWLLLLSRLLSPAPVLAPVYSSYPGSCIQLLSPLLVQAPVVLYTTPVYGSCLHTMAPFYDFSFQPKYNMFFLKPRSSN